MLDKTSNCYGYASRSDLAKARDLTLQELKALESVEADLRNGKLKHAHRIWAAVNRCKTPIYLNMNEWNCRSVACIGGHVEARCGYLAGEFFCKVDSHVDTPSSGLYELCFPSDRVMSQIRPLEAADAIRSFIETGWPIYD